MKLHAPCASAVALTLALSAPAKAENVNREFIALATISFTVLQKCEGYEFIDGSAQKAADQVGADFDTYGPATMNAVFAIMGWEYDRSKLIPEVTRQVRSNLNELIGELRKGDRYFCNKYGAVMLNVGFMRRKK
jgi:hypothetical protein